MLFTIDNNALEMTYTNTFNVCETLEMYVAGFHIIVKPHNYVACKVYNITTPETFRS